MRKRNLFACIAVLIVVAVFAVACTPDGDEGGAEKFGDGTFKSRVNDDGSLGLFAGSESQAVIEVVDELHKTEKKVYILGHQGDMYSFFGLIDLTTNTMQLCVSAGEESLSYDPAALIPTSLADSGTVVIARYSDFSEADRGIFAQLTED